MAQHEPAGRQFIGSITEDTSLSDEYRSDENEKGIHGRIPSSVFSYKDEMMWAKDYHFSTFLSDILIGR